MQIAANAPSVSKQPTGIGSTLLGGANNLRGWVPGFGPTSKGTFKGRCTQI
jgi:hypothetical protein